MTNLRTIFLMFPNLLPIVSTCSLRNNLYPWLPFLLLVFSSPLLECHLSTLLTARRVRSIRTLQAWFLWSLRSLKLVPAARHR
ncbi:hypothetical protein BDR07DRAFT_1430223, partial [Suillus spraguei]